MAGGGREVHASGGGVRSASVRAGLAAAQNAFDVSASAASAVHLTVVVPTLPAAASASVPISSAMTAAVPHGAVSQPAARPAAVPAGAVSRVLRRPATPVHSARAADPVLPVAVSAARADDLEPTRVRGRPGAAFASPNRRDSVARRPVYSAPEPSSSVPLSARPWRAADRQPRLLGPVARPPRPC